MIRAFWNLVARRVYVLVADALEAMEAGEDRDQNDFQDSGGGAPGSGDRYRPAS